jgi:hypothetical protein
VAPFRPAVRPAFRLREVPHRGLSGRPGQLCLACGRPVGSTELYVRLTGGDVAPAECGLYTPRSRRAA